MDEKQSGGCKTDIKFENTMEFFPKMFGMILFLSWRRAESFKVPIFVHREIIPIPNTNLSSLPAFDGNGAAAAVFTAGLHAEA